MSLVLGAVLLSVLWTALLIPLYLTVLVVEVPFLQAAFGTESLDAAHWLVCLAMASVVLWAEELAKLVRRRLRGRGLAGAGRATVDH